MMLWLNEMLEYLPAFDALATLAVRSAALVALGWLAAVLLKRALPSARQALWTAVVVGLVALPLLTATLPGWEVLPARLATPAMSPTASTPDSDAGSPLPSAPFLIREAIPGTPAAERATGLAWSEWAVLAWLAGTVALALVFAVGLWRLRRITRAASPASPALRSMAGSTARDFAVRRPVRVLVTKRLASPATWGLLSPVIVLPRTATQWSAERCRLVLAHEMAHVARGDWFWRLVAQLGCIVYWFNPLAWLAARRLRFEQELACDLAVLEGGARPSLYADHLLNIARAGATARALPLVALDMARRSQMEGRLMSILSDRPARRLRRGLILPVLSILAALPVVAAIQPQAPEAPPAPEAPASPESLESPEGLAPALAAPVAPEVPEAASVQPVLAPAPAPRPATSPSAAMAPKPWATLAPAPAPAVAPAPASAPEPVLAPPSPAGSEYAVLAAVAPQAEREAVPPAAVDPALTPEDRARAAELEARIAAKAAEIEALMGPIHEEMERAMEEGMGSMMEQMELLELEMRPLHDEMSRLGEEMSQRLMESMPSQLAMEDFSSQVEAIAREMEERSRLTEELVESGTLDEEALNEAVREMNEGLAPLREELSRLHQEMQERHRSQADMQEIMAPYREQMAELRRNLAPQRERMEELRRQFEPRRQEIDRIRQERMAEVRARLDALRAELHELSRERARTRQKVRERREHREQR